MASDFVTRGQALVAGGQLQDAVRVCRLGLLAQPTAVEGRLVLGTALLKLRRYDEVLAEMRVALELDGSSARALMLKGEALLRKGDAFQAAEALERARVLDPNSNELRGLLDEVERVAGVAAGSRDRSPRASGPAEIVETLTKHYPAHRGEAAPEPVPRASRPSAPPAAARAARPSQPPPQPPPARPAPGRSAPAQRPPPSEVPPQRPPPGERASPLRGRPRGSSMASTELPFEDRSATVEVDPALAGVEFYDDPEDPIAEPPTAANTMDFDLEGEAGAGAYLVESPSTAPTPAPRHVRSRLRGDVNDAPTQFGGLSDPNEAPTRFGGLAGLASQGGRSDFDDLATVHEQPAFLEETPLPQAAPVVPPRRTAVVPVAMLDEPATSPARPAAGRAEGRPLDVAQQRSAAAVDALFPENEPDVAAMAASDEIPAHLLSTVMPNTRFAAPAGAPPPAVPPPMPAAALRSSPSGPPPGPQPSSGRPPVGGAPVSGAPVSGAPVSGAPVSGAPGRPPMSGAGRPPVSGLPMSGPPMSGPPMSGPPMSGPPMSGPPMSGPPMGGRPGGPLMSGPPMSGPPMGGPPMSGRPMSGPPMSAPPMSGPPMGGRPIGGPPPAAPPLMGSSPPLMGPPPAAPPLMGSSPPLMGPPPAAPPLMGGPPPAAGVPRLGELAPHQRHTVFAGPDPNAPSRAQRDDMHTIRAGLGLEPERGARVAEPAPQFTPGAIHGGPTHERRDSTGIVVGQGPPPPTDSRIRLPRPSARPGEPSSTVHVASELSDAATSRQAKVVLALYATLAVAVIGGGIWAGFEIRGVLLDRDIAAARREAQALASDDTFGGYSRAREAYARIADARGSDADLAALARADAAMAAEFGHDVDAATAEVVALPADVTDAAVARIYVALAADDLVAAGAASAALTKLAPAEPMAPYLAGRVALLAERWEAAAESFRAALRAEQRPAVFVGLGHAEAARGQLAEAKAAYERALDLVPGHPEALIGRARALARGGSMPTDGQLERDLEALIAQAALPLDDQALGVAPAETAWAILALAEIALARSDTAAARKALVRVQDGRFAERDRPFAEALIADLVAVGDTTAARAVAEASVARWPGRLQPRIALAEVALRLDHPEQALSILEAAGDVAAGDLAVSASALALRGRARLALGSFDEAQTDLDAALALEPELIDALVARAQLDLLRGQARDAIARLAARYAAGGLGELGLVYARALRANGQAGEARTVLEHLTGMGAASGAAWLELAELAREGSDLKAAREAFEAALRLLPAGVPTRVDASLGIALLSLDTGNALGARETLDELVALAPDNGRALIESARVDTITGALDVAQRRLEQAEAQPAVPRWQLSRERGRLALKKRDLAVAVSELERAVSLRASDGETRLLLIDAHLAAEDAPGAHKVLDGVLRDFTDRPAIQQLALGRLDMFDANDDGALAAFAKARAQLEQSKAPPRAVADAMTWLGRAYYYSDQLERARTLLTEAVDLDPSQADAWLFLGFIEKERGNRKSAFDRFFEATRLDEANADAWFLLGETALSQRQRKTARQALERYLALSPEGDRAGDARAMLRGL